MPGHPAMKIAMAHKKRVEEWLFATFKGATSEARARQLARQTILLLDGSFAVVLLHRDPTYMETAADAASNLIRSELKRSIRRPS